ncbi:MAG TPA: hypothetical protein VKA09_04305 [Nitrososphaeraceae archaeon]|nr:hypothetical protein [Nitrososphaeraceae archaeon]
MNPRPQLLSLKAALSLSRWTVVIEGELYCSNPHLLHSAKAVLCLVEGAIEED